MSADAELISRLRLICGEAHVLTGPALLAAYRAPGAVVVLPETASEVAAVVAACAQSGSAYAVRGAGSAAALGAPVVICVSRMRAISEPDLAAALVTAECGAPVVGIRRLLPSHLNVLPDLPDPGVATVGGALAGGYGRRSILSLGFVTADGRTVTVARPQAGYDLAGDFVGSRGQRGVAVRVRLRLLPKIEFPGAGDE